MQRRERRAADREGRALRTLMEPDFLLGVADISRLGALRFRCDGEADFQAPTGTGVPGLIQLGALLSAAERIDRGEETDDDLQMIFAPGSSLGGARPKASVIDQNGELSIAKFPKDSDTYRVEVWESISLTLGGQTPKSVCPQHELLTVNDKKVLLSRRFDRSDARRESPSCRPCP